MGNIYISPTPYPPFTRASITTAKITSWLGKIKDQRDIYINITKQVKLENIIKSQQQNLKRKENKDTQRD